MLKLIMLKQCSVSFIVMTAIILTLVPGLRCEDDDACVSNPCRLGASCETLPANGSYQCVCEPGWRGRDCDLDVDECAESAYTPQFNIHNVLDPNRRIWCEEKHETESTIKEFKGDTQNIMKFMQMYSDKAIGLCILFWAGNHIEPNFKDCAALKLPDKLNSWKSRGWGGDVPHCPIAGEANGSGVASVHNDKWRTGIQPADGEHKALRCQYWQLSV